MAQLAISGAKGALVEKPPSTADQLVLSTENFLGNQAQSGGQKAINRLGS